MTPNETNTDGHFEHMEESGAAAGNLCGQIAGDQATAGDIELLDFDQCTASILRISCVDSTNHIVYLKGPTDVDASTYTPWDSFPSIATLSRTCRIS